uniref:Calcyphosine n=1 Tax=Ursus maritimus TaxID=29073 RepID=A0A452U227_URSMA
TSEATVHSLEAAVRRKDELIGQLQPRLRAQCLSRRALGIQGLGPLFNCTPCRSLDSGELQRGLAELGLVLDAAEAEGVCRRWDRDGSGTLDLDEFLRALRVTLAEFQDYYSGVSASMDTDEEFVAMMTSAWQL